MRFVDEFRDADLGRAVAGEILATVEPGRHYKVMEVCGGHTHSIYKYGVDDLLPANVELVHGHSPAFRCLAADSRSSSAASRVREVMRSTN